MRVDSRSIFAATLAALLLIGSAAPPGVHAQTSEWRIQDSAEGLTPCDRLEAPASGDSVVVREAATLCDVVAVPVVTLRPSLEGLHPDPAGEVLVASDGRYFTASTNAPDRQILVWDDAGQFQQAVGRSGEGPGEFDRRGIHHYLGAGDTLFVADAARRWTVFDPELTYRRTFTAPVHYASESTHLHEGTILTSRFVGGSRASFGSFDLSTESVRTFGPDAGPRARVSGVDHEGRLWVAPENGGGTGLVLEAWDPDEGRVRTLTRPAPWLPLDGYERLRGEPSLPEFERVHVDPDGLLWVRVVVRDPRWRFVEGPGKAEVMTELYDGRMEIIDPRSGVVLASFRIDGPETELPPFAELVPGTRLGYRTVQDDLGFESIEIYRIHLVAKDGGGAEGLRLRDRDE